MQAVHQGALVQRAASRPVRDRKAISRLHESSRESRRADPSKVAAAGAFSLIRRSVKRLFRERQQPPPEVEIFVVSRHARVFAPRGMAGIAELRLEQFLLEINSGHEEQDGKNISTVIHTRPRHRRHGMEPFQSSFSGIRSCE